jgi:dinuclear metal center YbgI/SA1388 family protein
LAHRDDIVKFLDQVLEIHDVKDPYCSNGLQVEGTEFVERIGFAVDACQETFKALADCQMIVTHHGLFWPSIKNIRGAMRQSLGFLIEGNINLYPVHLPLDVHAEFGNNVQLIRALGWQVEERFDQVGWTATGMDTSPQDISSNIQSVLNSPVRLLNFGHPSVRRVAVSSGGGSIGLLHSAVSAGADLLVTGEASHPVYHAAKELELNVILAGHYATETWGVRALMPLLEREFGVETKFVDIPTDF